jgi:hypothetical protein
VLQHYYTATNERKDIFELLSKRRKKSSTIFCAQYKSEGWYEQLGGSDEPLACFLQDLFGQSCKTFLDIVACPNWTKLHVQIGQSCKASASLVLTSLLMLCRHFHLL